MCLAKWAQQCHTLRSQVKRNRVLPAGEWDRIRYRNYKLVKSQWKKKYKIKKKNKNKQQQWVVIKTWQRWQLKKQMNLYDYIYACLRGQDASRHITCALIHTQTHKLLCKLEAQTGFFTNNGACVCTHTLTHVYIFL